ncbi:MAG: hypothetical protein ACXIVQ_17780 [Acidimicrobiales bacterium]
MNALILFAAPSSVVLVGLAIRAYRRSGASADAWARERELTLDDENRAMVVSYLQTSRSLRVLGVLAGPMVALVVALAVGEASLVPSYMWLPAAVAGYMVGIVVAEVLLPRPKSQRAAVRPRRLPDYLSPWALRSQRRAAVGAGALAAIAVAVPTREPAWVSISGRVAIFVGVLVVVASAEGIQRWLIRRPQPVVSAALLEADDAIRRQSVHSIAGAGIGMQWLLVGAASWALAVSDVQFFRWTMWVPAMLSSALALAACTLYDRGWWQIRRIRV